MASDNERERIVKEAIEAQKKARQDRVVAPSSRTRLSTDQLAAALLEHITKNEKKVSK